MQYWVRTPCRARSQPTQRVGVYYHETFASVVKPVLQSNLRNCGCLRLGNRAVGCQDRLSIRQYRWRDLCWATKRPSRWIKKGTLAQQSLVGVKIGTPYFGFHPCIISQRSKAPPSFSRPCSIQWQKHLHCGIRRWYAHCWIPTCRDSRNQRKIAPSLSNVRPRTLLLLPCDVCSSRPSATNHILDSARIDRAATPRLWNE